MDTGALGPRYVRGMPVRKVRGGYRWGKTGKTYRSRAAAVRQGRAIEARRRRKK